MRRAASTSESRHPARPAPLALLLLALAGCQPPAPTLTAELPAFDGTARLEIRAADPMSADVAAAELRRELARLTGEWHAWKPSPVTRINAALAAGETVQAPASVLVLLERSRPLVEASDGLFDPAIGSLIAAWGFHTESFPVATPPPTSARIARWRDHRPRLTDLAVSGDRLSSVNPTLQLDFGAVNEGFAAERALAILRKHRIRQALLSFGGDYVALGDGDGQPWRALLRDPFGGDLGYIELHSGEGLFSTGNYSKFRASPTGARWAHILDPRTGFPARGSAAVAVLDEDPVLADAAATALYVAGPAGFESTARRMGVACAVLLTEENEILVTAAMALRLHLYRDPVPLGEPIVLGKECRKPL